MTVRGWKSGRNCASVATTLALRLGALRTATFAQATGPEPTTRTLASADSGALVSTPTFILFQAWMYSWGLSLVPERAGKRCARRIATRSAGPPA